MVRAGGGVRAHAIGELRACAAALQVPVQAVRGHPERRVRLPHVLLPQVHAQGVPGAARLLQAFKWQPNRLGQSVSADQEQGLLVPLCQVHADPAEMEPSQNK